MVERPKVGVRVFVIHDGKILVGLRQGSHGEGTWAPPGGHLEMQESFESCAMREVFEETGIIIKNVRFLACTNDPMPAKSKHYVTISLVADWAEGKAERREPDRCLEWRWVAWPNVPEPRYKPLQDWIDKGGTPFLV